jgi:hypothetical protein
MLSLDKPARVGVWLVLISGPIFILIDPKHVVARLILLGIVAIGAVALSVELDWTTQREEVLSVVQGLNQYPSSRSALRTTLAVIAAVALTAIFGVITWEIDKPSKKSGGLVALPAPPATAPRKRSPKTTSVVEGLSEEDLAVELHDRASRIHSDWKNFWDNEDADSFKKQNRLKYEIEISHGDEGTKREFNKVTRQRESARKLFDEKYAQSVRDVAPIAEEAAKRLGDEGTLQDKVLPTIINGLLTGKIRYSMKRGDFANYLDELADRLFKPHPQPSP